MKSILNYKALIVISLMLTVSCQDQKTYQSADEIIAEMKVGMQTIDAQELNLKMNDEESYFFLIDVREPNEHNFGFIPSSFNIPAGIILFNISNEKFWEDQMMYSPELSDEIIVYCKKGKRSILAVNYLEQLGFQNVKYIDGGWKNWELSFPLLYEKNLDFQAHEEVSDDGGC